MCIGSCSHLIGARGRSLYASFVLGWYWRVSAHLREIGGAAGYPSRMPSIGPLELGIILLIILVVFGPKRLPGLGRQLGTGMREFKDSITGKDRDDDDDDEDRDAFGESARRPGRGELDRSPSEPEVVTGEARREDQPASRADS